MDGIAASIKDACGEGVFSVKPNDGQKEKTVETVKREALSLITLLYMEKNIGISN